MLTSDLTGGTSAGPTSPGPTPARAPSSLTDEGGAALVDAVPGSVEDHPVPRGEE